MSERMHVTTHFLQMHSAPTTDAVPCPADTEVVKTRGLSPAAYRELYTDVGSPWLWYERSELPDDELAPLIEDPAISIYTLVHRGNVAGYSELRHGPAHDVQIVYFGLRPAYIGKGLGAFFLDWTVRHAFSGDTRRVWVHTCSLDHPRALHTYELAGFESYRSESGWVNIPDAALARRRREPNL